MTANNKPTHSKASDVLTALYNYGRHDGDPSLFGDKPEMTRDQAAHQLYQDILGLIGEDEIVAGAYGAYFAGNDAKNELRTEIRTALATYFGQREV